MPVNPQELGGGLEQTLPPSSRKNQSRQHLNLGLLASRLRLNLSLGHLVCSASFRQPWPATIMGLEQKDKFGAALQPCWARAGWGEAQQRGPARLGHWASWQLPQWTGHFRPMGKFSCPMEPCKPKIIALPRGKTPPPPPSKVPEVEFLTVLAKGNS